LDFFPDKNGNVRAAGHVLETQTVLPVRK
jgi:hypothetical protein